MMMMMISFELSTSLRVSHDYVFFNGIYRNMITENTLIQKALLHQSKVISLKQKNFKFFWLEIF